MNLSIVEPIFWLFTLNVILVLIALFHMLYQRRSPQSLISWMLTIILLPYLGVLIYFIFGLNKSLSNCKKPKIEMLDISIDKPRSQIAMQINSILYANNIAGMTDYNKMDILDKGTTAYNHFMQAIQNAKTHIHIETYILELDITGQHILDALIEKAKQGVEVRLLLDSIGSFVLYFNQKPLKKLTTAGGSYAFFHPFLFTANSRRINLRNHRKIYLFDQKILLTGGMNLSNDYFGLAKNTSKHRRWVDLMFKIQGPNTFHYQTVFNEDWFYTTQERLSSPPKPELFPQGEMMQVVPAGPDMVSETLFETLLNSIFYTKNTIQISGPYFIPDNSIMNALLIAIKRGVKVTLLVSKSSSHLIFDLGRRSYMRELLEAGGEVLYYKKSLLHAKIIIFDSQSAMIGSANFDCRSLFINYEMVNFIYAKPHIEYLSNWFEKLLIQSELYQPSNSKTSRVFENMTRIIAPLL